MPLSSRHKRHVIKRYVVTRAPAQSARMRCRGSKYSLHGFVTALGGACRGEKSLHVQSSKAYVPLISTGRRLELSTGQIRDNQKLHRLQAVSTMLQLPGNFFCDYPRHAIAKYKTSWLCLSVCRTRGVLLHFSSIGNA